MSSDADITRLANAAERIATALEELAECGNKGWFDVRVKPED